MKLKLALITALTVFGLVLPRTSQAASFTFGIDEPKASIGLNNFDLTGAAHDLPNATRNITVQCFKKGPNDSNYSQFDTDQILIPGGNVFSCSVNNGILNTVGTYSFYATASVSSPAFELITSKTYSVYFNDQGPSTPGSYSKNKVNDCDYKISFHTANDGKTVKVQLFRSDTFAISVNDSSVLAQLFIGPDQDGSITNSVPVCTKDYYYVIRAVDSLGNVSDTTGDSFTTTSSTTKVTPTPKAGGALEINLANSQVTASPSGEPTTNIELTATPTPSVLGTSTENRSPLYKWLLGLLVVSLGWYIWKQFQETK